MPALDKWDQKFIQAAFTIAQWSPDPSSKIGAIAISEQNLPLSWGWNAFPRKFSKLEDKVTREEKYKWVVHAEMNCIYNACRESVCLRNSTFYIYGIPPCVDCAKGIVQVGAKRVVTVAYESIKKKWRDSFEESKFLFKDTGIEWSVNLL